MQKALVQMNLQLPFVISDITGQTGLQIIRAIVAGERDPAQHGAVSPRPVSGDARRDHGGADRPLPAGTALCAPTESRTLRRL
jgi:hypothetical protein